MNRLAVCLLVPLMFIVGCSSGGAQAPGGTGTLSIEVTDAPIDHSMVEQATIWVTTVRVHGESEADGGFRTIYDGSPVELDLLELRNGLRHALVRADLPVGSYGQMRLVISRAFLRLTNGVEYQTEDGTIRLTSQDTSGFKVHFDPPVQISRGLTSSILLDVDLTKTFKPIPGNDPMNADRFHLAPVIRVANLDQTGDIQGLVQRDDGTGNLIGVGGATVFIMAPGGVPEDAIATTATEDNGSFAVIGLEPGTFDVFARRGTFTGRVNDQVVSIGRATLVDVLVSE